MSAERSDRIELVRRLLGAGDAARAAGRWAEALGAYREAATHLTGMAGLHHNLALCELALGRPEEALREAERAVALDPALWQAQLVRVKALRRLRRGEEALTVLEGMPAMREPAVEQERILLTLHELGDAAAGASLAQAVAAAFPGLSGEAAADMELNGLVARLYDPGGASASALAEAFKDYSRRHCASGDATEPVGSARPARTRVGLISPQFFASPVYFFGIGALGRLATSVDLVFFSRSTREDWATRTLRTLAHEWVDVAPLGAPELERELRRHALDVLIDMGGWMDRTALAALAAKPARRMFKWVGGQALSTGLASFDGFLGDRWQSPPETQPLYAEPLVLLDGGYVSYTPPPYLPRPRPADAGLVLGVISNPLKVSRAFLAFVAGLAASGRGAGVLPEIRFIDKRYRHAALRRRIDSALGDDVARFVTPADHLDYLAEIGRLSAVIDTFPYSGGLTTMEALQLGVPCYTRAGTLFCERHSWAHCKYAGLDEAAFTIPSDGNLLERVGAPGGARASLLPAGSPRTDHDRLAEALLGLIEA